MIILSFHLQPQFKYELFHILHIDICFVGSQSDLKHWRRKRLQRQTAPWKDWVENIKAFAGCGGLVSHVNKGNANDRSVQNVFSRSALNVPYPLPVFLSSCSFFLFFFLYLEAFFVGQLLLSSTSSRAWSSLRKWFQWRFPLDVFPLYAWQSARSVCLSWFFYWLWISYDQGYSTSQISGSIHLPFPCFLTDVGKIP